MNNNSRTLLQQRPIIRLVIEFRPDGTLSITGPINDKGFAYGLLEMAKDAIREHVTKSQEQVVKPQFNVPDDLLKQKDIL